MRSLVTLLPLGDTTERQTIPKRAVFGSKVSTRGPEPLPLLKYP